VPARHTSGLLDRAGYLQRWSALHGGVDPAASPLVRGWLGLTYVLARPLAARRVPPDLITLVGLLLSVSVVPLAAMGGRWPLAAVLVVVVSGLVDNLDGAVAVMTDRATRWGSVLDSLADRCSDAAYVVALLALGGFGDPGAVMVCAAAAAGLVLLQEYARARATAAGMSDVGVVTVSERPTRVIGAAMFCLGAGLYPAHAEYWGAAGLVFGVLVGLVGLTQLLVVVRRRLA
jgi:CDP-diacylglycerol--glycerol-3-phosphate 3-phosphatidyltransferase